jgi:ribosomal protein S18 acetylase RimI-like enzyme
VSSSKPWPRIAPADGDDLDAALALLYRRLPPAERDCVRERTRRSLASGELDARGLLVARDGGQVIGAMLVQPAPGAVGLVWPPQAEPGGGRDAVEDALVRAALAWFEKLGLKLAQALLPPEHPELGEPLQRNGFRLVTTLLFQRRPVVPPLDTPLTLTFEPLGPENRAVWEDTLRHTYGESGDCPELSGRRSLADVIDGHAGQGGRAAWWLVREAGRPVGVSLLHATPEWDAWEIAYCGLIPAARRRGLGRQLVGHAVAYTAAAGARQLVLSVDSRNRAACGLYQSCGFTTWERQDVYLSFLAIGGERHDV